MFCDICKIKKWKFQKLKSKFKTTLKEWNFLTVGKYLNSLKVFEIYNVLIYCLMP